MSFIVPGAEPPVEATITNAAFFPDIDPAAIRGQMRLDGTITEPRLLMAVTNAIQHINDELADWRLAQQSEGFTTLSDVPGKSGAVESIGGENAKVILYRRAVACYAAAECADRFMNFDSSGKGQKRAEEQTIPIDDLRRDYIRAIADIQGRPRTVVELI